MVFILMAVEYKNKIVSVTSTGSDETIYTCPTSTSLVKYMAIVKTFTIFNTTGGAGTLYIRFLDSSASSTDTIRMFLTSAFGTQVTVNATDMGPIVLESADVLKMQADVQPIRAFVSVMEVSEELRGV